MTTDFTPSPWAATRRRPGCCQSRGTISDLPRSIARYALHAANSCRFFLGIDLDADHQDHLAWRKSLPNGHGFLFSYEGFRTEAHCDADHRFQPYATGDPIALFSHKYNGARRAILDRQAGVQRPIRQHLAIHGQPHRLPRLDLNATDVPGIIAWDLTRTDYFKPACYPSYLLYNPYEQEKKVTSTRASARAIGMMRSRGNLSAGMSLASNCSQWRRIRPWYWFLRRPAERSSATAQNSRSTTSWWITAVTRRTL